MNALNYHACFAESLLFRLAIGSFGLSCFWPVGLCMFFSDSQSHASQLKHSPSIITVDEVLSEGAVGTS